LRSKAIAALIESTCYFGYLDHRFIHLNNYCFIEMALLKSKKSLDVIRHTRS